MCYEWERRIIAHLWAVSSVGRALRLHRSCHRFKSDTVHHLFAINDFLKSFLIETL